MNQMQQLEQLMNQYPSGPAHGHGRCRANPRPAARLERFLRWGQRGMGDPRSRPRRAASIPRREAYEHLKYSRASSRCSKEGYIVRTSHGLKLTPKGMRKIGDKALREIFQMLNKGRWGNHNTAARGSQGDRLEETRKRIRRPDERQHHRDADERLGKTEAGEPLRSARDFPSSAGITASETRC